RQEQRQITKSLQRSQFQQGLVRFSWMIPPCSKPWRRKPRFLKKLPARCWRKFTNRNPQLVEVTCTMGEPVTRIVTDWESFFHSPNGRKQRLKHRKNGNLYDHREENSWQYR